MRNSTPKNKPCVYVVGYAEIPGIYKIGQSNNLKSRLTALSMASPFDLVVYHTIYNNRNALLELRLHRIFAPQRIKGEWFRLSDADMEYIRTVRYPTDMGKYKLALPEAFK